MSTGQIVSRMSGDTVLVQDAIGEKVRIFSKQLRRTTAEKITRLTHIKKMKYYYCRLASLYNLLLHSSVVSV
jgi:hypothetical protein